ncbi:histone H1-like isoform X2 [Lycium barbarum]|uniref:histone H1-like isoform X2 n=1 Tax=Lycium barbarum TaxID=112863 RepID=UPI00293EFE5A|nr:histone H1-like isoform X2 [Lycium barbarum]
MTCSICKSSSHNRRGCPLRPPTSATAPASTSAPSRRRYSMPPAEARRRPRGKAPAAPAKPRGKAPPAAAAKPRRKAPTAVAAPKPRGKAAAKATANKASTRAPDAATAPAAAAKARGKTAVVPTKTAPTAIPSKRKCAKPPVPLRPKATTKVNSSQQSSTGSTRKSGVLDNQEACTSMEGSRSK